MLLRWFKDKIEAFQAQRKLARQTDPRNFKKMAEEIRDLALLASQLNPREKDIHKLIRNVMVEMERLSELADRPEFRKLSTGQKTVAPARAQGVARPTPGIHRIRSIAHPYPSMISPAY